MRKLFLLLAYCFISACSQKDNKEAIKISDNSITSAVKMHLSNFEIDTMFLADGTIKKDTINYADDLPKITPLPFGKDVSSNKLYTGQFYDKLIYKDPERLSHDNGFTPETRKDIKIYKLPIIKHINYIKTAKRDSINCKNGKTFGTFLKLKNYRYRLPDIANYECYFSCDYDSSYKNYAKEIRNVCQFLIYEKYGYLILYDPVTQVANVIALFYDTFGGDYLSYGRHFYIDKKYHISLVDFTTGEEESYIYNRLGISILKSGEIVLKNQVI